MEILALVVSGCAAAAAIAAAIYAKESARAASRSADAAETSARAQERAAAAAEAALVIEGERTRAEKHGRDAGQAPVLDAGARANTRWALGLESLEGAVVNLGPSTARIDNVLLDAGDRTYDGSYRGGKALPGGDTALRPHHSINVSFPWSGGEDTDAPIIVVVLFRALQTDYYGLTTFELRRSGTDENGRPEWIASEGRVFHRQLAT